MKHLFFGILVVMTLPIQAFSNTSYECSSVVPKVDLIAGNTVSGSIDGISFSFKSKGTYDEIRGVFVWTKPEPQAIKLTIRPLGFYDSDQNPLDGEITFNGVAHLIDCYKN